MKRKCDLIDLTTTTKTTTTKDGKTEIILPQYKKPRIVDIRVIDVARTSNEVVKFLKYGLEFRLSSKMKTLSLTQCIIRLNHEHMRLLAKCIQSNSTLENLNLRDIKFGDKGVKILVSMIGPNSGLKSIDIRGNMITRRGIKLISERLFTTAHCFPTHVITRINLFGNKIASIGAATIASIILNNKTITDLNIGDTNLRDEGARYIADALNPAFDIKANTTLKILGVAFNRITCEGARHFATCLRANSSLKELRLQENYIEDDGGVFIGLSLEYNYTLEHLNLTSNGIDGDGIKILARGMKRNKSITYLALNGCAFGNEGAMALAKALKLNSTLKSLDISDNRIGSVGANAISNSLMYNSTLLRLAITDCYIDIEGLNTFANDLNYNLTLRSIEISPQTSTDINLNAKEVAYNYGIIKEYENRNNNIGEVFACWRLLLLGIFDSESIFNIMLVEIIDIIGTKLLQYYLYYNIVLDNDDGNDSDDTEAETEEYSTSSFDDSLLFY